MAAPKTEKAVEIKTAKEKFQSVAIEYCFNKIFFVVMWEWWYLMDFFIFVLIVRV
jgi:hypothetical protein